MSTHCKCWVLLLLAAFPLNAVAEEDQKKVNVLQLADRIEEQFQQLSGLEFTYDVNSTTVPSAEALDQMPAEAALPEVVSATDTFRCLRSKPDSVEAEPKAMRCWVRRSLNGRGTGSIQRFAAYDGSHTHTFRREKRSLSFFDALSGWRGPGDYYPPTENTFESFLFLRVNGIGMALEIPEKLKNLNLSNYELTNTKAVDGKKVYVLYARGHELNPSFEGIEYEAEVITEPAPMVLRWEAREAGQDEPSMLYEVTRVGDFEGVAYPAAGKFTQQSKGLLPDESYQFEVTKVARLKEDAVENWMPKWPAGTSVRDDEASATEED